MIDIIERLMDYEGHGTTATDRVKLREEAAVLIFQQRAALHSLRTALTNIRDVVGTSTEAHMIARRALS